MIDFNLRHQLGTFTLNISLAIGQECVALFGASGAGKSQTLQCLAGLVQPEAGRIILDGQVVFDSERGVNWPPQRRRVGYVTQAYALFPHLSVGKNIAYGLRGQPRDVIKRAVTDMLTLIRLTDFADRRPHELSGGQQQRVALARALIINPSVLLLDEPFSALDGPTRSQLRQEVRQWQQQLNIPTLLVTHDLAEANLIADRIAVYQQGNLLQVGSPAEVMHRPASLAVAHLTGNENCFPGTIESVTEESLTVMVGAMRLKTAPYQFIPGDPVYCCIRPEQVILLRPDKQISHRSNVAQGRLVAIMTDGLGFHLKFRLVGRRLDSQKPHDFSVVLPLHVYESLNPRVNQTWHVSFKPGAIHLIGN